MKRAALFARYFREFSTMPVKLTKRAIEALKPKSSPYEVRDSELKGLLVRIERGGTKTFWLRYAFGGKRSNRYKLGVFPNVSAEGARSLAKAASGDVAKGIDPAARKKEEKAKANKDRGSTLRIYLKEKYEPWARVHLKSADEQLTRIRSDFEKQLDKPLQTFNKKLIGELQQDWLAAGLKPRTVNRDLQRISGVLSRAVADEMIDTHPLKAGAVKPLKFDKKKIPRFLKPTEEAALRKALADREQRMRTERKQYNEWLADRQRELMPEHDGTYVDYLRPMALLALNCGLRRGELFNLTWDDIDSVTNTVTVRGEADDDGGEGSKSGQSRVVPLNAEAQSVIEGWRRPRAKGLVFPSPDTGKRFNNINKSWDGVRKAAGLPRLQLRWLRDTFASKLVQRGVPLFTVKELLGHEDLSTTMIYAFLQPANLQAAVALLDAAA